MRIPLFLAVAQWALLAALGLLVLIMYRQLGRVFGQNKPAAAEHGPAAGTVAAAFEYTRLADESLQYFVPGGGQAALVAFADPSCQACDRLVAAMNVVDSAGELAGLRVLLLMSDPPKYLQISAAFQSTRLEVGQIMTQATVAAYQATATPLLVAIDSSGVVRSAGAAAEVADVRAFIQASLVPPPGMTLAVAAAVPQRAEPRTSSPAAGSATNER
jgi:hypothetical protein